MTDGQFTRSFFGMVGGLVIWTILLIILARSVSKPLQAALDEERIDSRSKDISATVVKAGEVNIGGEDTQVAAASSGATEAATPESNYQTSCAACHASGAAGAPIVGNAEQWGPRIAQGADVLYNAAINGLNAMPPKGGSNLSDDDIKAVVDYMIGQAQ